MTPEIYVGIAIDAAGVATGTMASCFFLPMMIGYTAVHYNIADNTSTDGALIMRNGFGVVGIMAILPIIVCELIGIFAIAKSNLRYKKVLNNVREPDDSQVIHLPM